MNKKEKIQMARKFRRSLTKSEKILWQALRNRQFNNLKFRRQHIFKGYVIDFYCFEFKLAIEIDGSIHAQVDKQFDDKDRQNILEDYDIKFFRISNHEVENNLEYVLKKLNIFISDNYSF